MTRATNKLLYNNNVYTEDAMETSRLQSYQLAASLIYLIYDKFNKNPVAQVDKDITGKKN